MTNETQTYRMPAEWETHTSTWIAWPHNAQDWPGRFQPIPWVYFWLAGALSSFLDNAPTYLVFFNLAGGDPAALMGEGAATLYVGWPENSDTLALPARIYEQARAFAQATKREDRLLEAPAVEVEVIVFAPGPELEEPSVAVLMDLSDLPLAQIEMHFAGLETDEETLDWFIDVVVAGAWKLVEMGL